jgi:hypothetical protein
LENWLPMTGVAGLLNVGTGLAMIPAENKWDPVRTLLSLALLQYFYLWEERFSFLFLW